MADQDLRVPRQRRHFIRRFVEPPAAGDSGQRIHLGQALEQTRAALSSR
jgi:hypothetical protein